MSDVIQRDVAVVDRSRLVLVVRLSEPEIADFELMEMRAGPAHRGLEDAVQSRQRDRFRDEQSAPDLRLDPNKAHPQRNDVVRQWKPYRGTLRLKVTVAEARDWPSRGLDIRAMMLAREGQIGERGAPSGEAPRPLSDFFAQGLEVLYLPGHGRLPQDGEPRAYLPPVR